MVPNGWENKHLSEIASFSQGIQIPIENQYTVEDPNTCRFLRISDFVYQNEEPRFIDMPDSKFIVEANDLSMIRYGSAGAGDLVRGLRGAIANNLFRVIPNELKVSKEYLWVYLRQEKVKDFLFSGSTSSTMPAVSFKLVGKVPIAIPPLPEQRKIARILSTWDRGIATTEKLIDASKQQKKALMQQLLTGKKRLVNPETGKAFEGDWEEVKLANICNKITDGAHNSPASVEDGLPMYSVKDMGKSGFKKGTARLIGKEDYLCLEKQNCRPLINDILIAKDGSILKHCFVMEKQCDGVILSSIAILRPDLEKIYPAFVAHFLSQDYVKKYVAKVFTTGSGVPRIVLKDFKSIKLKLGSLAEQQKIASVLTAADEEIKLLEAKLAHFKHEKKALMQQLLTGKRRVTLPY